jgi:hypothetical protein
VFLHFAKPGNKPLLGKLMDNDEMMTVPVDLFQDLVRCTDWFNAQVISFQKGETPKNHPDPGAVIFLEEQACAIKETAIEYYVELVNSKIHQEYGGYASLSDRGCKELEKSLATYQSPSTFMEWVKENQAIALEYDADGHGYEQIIDPRS